MILKEVVKISRKPTIISDISIKDINFLKQKGVLTRIRFGKVDISTDFLKNWYDYIKEKYGISIVDKNIIKDSELNDEFKIFLNNEYDVTDLNLIDFLQRNFKELIVDFRNL